MRKSAVLLAVVWFASCLGAGRPGKPAASAIWVASGAEALPVDALAELARAGASDLFVPAAELAWEGSTPRLRPLSLDGVPKAMHPTLVVSGEFSAAADPADAGKALVAAVGQLRLESEARGRVPAGVHFDLRVKGNLAEVLSLYANLLGRIRAELPRDLFLSAGLERAWLADPTAAEATREFAGNVDFLVAHLYGQRPGEPEDETAWQIERVVKDVRLLEELEVPYQVGVETVGEIAWLRGGATRERSTEMSLKPLLTLAALRLEHGFSLASGDRQIYTFRAQSASQVGDWALQAGDALRVVRTATPFLQALRARLAQLGLKRHLGESYRRAPRAGEALTPSLASLLAALQEKAVTPDLVVALEPVEGGRALRLRLENRNDEGSELSVLEHNYIEVVAKGGLIGNVEAGGFPRYALFREGEAANSVRSVRAPDRVRFYLPVLEGRDQVVSGDIEIRDATQVTASAAFLLPDGNTVVSPLAVWPPVGL
jgi:hypothetical protein